MKKLLSCWIEHVFCDAENVLDEFECETLRRQVVQAHGSTTTKVAHFFSSSNPLVFHCSMTQQIKRIQKRLEKAAADRHKFGLESIDVDHRHVVHRRDMKTHSYVVDSDEWEFVGDNEVWNSIKSESAILPALKLSFDEMSPNLRRCFGLFHLYPCGYAFNSFDITSLWGALGLLPSPNRNRILKHSANQYFCELLSRSFLRDFVDYGIGFDFKIHDLVHDIARYLGRDSIIVRYPFVFRPEHRYVQHLSFLENLGIENFPIHKFEGVRTVLFPTRGVGANSDVFLLKCVSRCKRLRFLDLSDPMYKVLSPYIGKLKHLRYLSLENNTNLKRLPNSLCNLLKLEVLILSGCTELVALPKGLRNLISLQHLEITTKLRVLPEDEIANLSSLQTLRIESCNNVESLFGGIKLPTLKMFFDKCDVLELSNNDLSNLRLKIVNLISLPRLCVTSCPNMLSLPGYIHRFTTLKGLEIDGYPELLQHLTIDESEEVEEELE
ncbi:hypothetical protein VNO78_17114 [Psophocarpus tetragonolobus]|uniref:Uncharacterized protein n=1 Tax=Psophocarpus tetragonolobus TaxID=3891 RepID=A0AAN9SI19_PSOTE